MMRWLIRVVLTLAVLAVVAVTALLLIPSDKVAEVLSRRIEAATGQRFTVAGGVSATLWPEPGVRIGDVRLDGPEGGDPILTARSLTVAVDRQAIWGGTIRVTRVTLDAPVIRLGRDAAGRANWDALTGTGATGTAPPDSADPAPAAAAPGFDGLTLDRGTISDGTVSYTDAQTGKSWSAEGVALTMTLPPPGNPAVVDFAALVQGVTVKGRAEIAALDQAAAGGVSAVTLSLTSGTSEASGASRLVFTGRAGFLPPVAEGALDADLQNPAALGGLLGLALPGLPQGLGRDRMAVAGDVTWTAERSLHLRAGQVQLDGNRLTGAFDLETAGQRPMLTARLKGEAIVLPGTAAPGNGGTGTGAAAAAGWSTAPIDASALGLLDARLRLDAASLTADGLTVAPVSATITLDRARAVVDLAQAGLFGGTLTGQVVANNRSGLSLGGDLTAAGLDLATLLQASAGTDRLGGVAAGRIRFLGSGQTEAAIMAGLSGSGDIAVKGGTLRGVDLARLLRSYDPAAIDAAAVTPFDSLRASFAIAGGTLDNRDLALTGPDMRATGAGQVMLGPRQIDYRLTPVALTGEQGRELAVPVMIRGPWSNPEIAPDLETFARQRLKLDDAALQARLDAEKAKAAARVGTELGLEPLPGESLEDAARRKLQEQALKGLGNLLGGN